TGCTGVARWRERSCCDWGGGFPADAFDDDGEGDVVAVAEPGVGGLPFLPRSWLGLASRSRSRVPLQQFAPRRRARGREGKPSGQHLSGWLDLSRQRPAGCPGFLVLAPARREPTRDDVRRG